MTCSWNNHCDLSETTAEINSLEDLLNELDEFLEDCAGVEAFSISLDGCDDCFSWDDEDLPRSKDIGDVWNKVQKQIKQWFNNIVDTHGTCNR